MLFLLVTLSSFVVVWGYAPLREPGPVSGYRSDGSSDFQDVMGQMNRDLETEGAFFDLGNSRMDGLGPLSAGFLPGRSTKDAEFLESGGDYDLLLGNNHFPTIRDPEYMQQSTLWGSKFMSGGTGESQKVKGQKAQAEVKTDAILPAYCNPPNPCPVGFTAEDGCIEAFENSAAFSRAYQGSQDCMCDTEHMFDCSDPDTEDTEIDLGQQNFLSDLQHLQGQHKSVMAKKFYNKKSHQHELSKLNDMAKQAARNSPFRGLRPNQNPFLQGEKLPIAAKKGNIIPH